jgi:hypothetical protein
MVASVNLQDDGDLFIFKAFPAKFHEEPGPAPNTRPCVPQMTQTRPLRVVASAAAMRFVSHLPDANSRNIP